MWKYVHNLVKGIKCWSKNVFLVAKQNIYHFVVGNSIQSSTVAHTDIIKYECPF